MRPLIQVLDANRSPLAGVFNPSDYVNTVILVAGAAQTQAVPAGARLVNFSAANEFYAKIGAVATVPATAVTAGTGSSRSPSLCSVDGATFVGLVAAAATTVTMEYYS